MAYAELGVYILGSMALALLAVAGVSFDNDVALIAAVFSAGSAYLSQFCVAAWLANEGDMKGLRVGNTVFMLISLGCWIYGAVSLLQ